MRTSSEQHRMGADGTRKIDELRVLVIDDDADSLELTGFVLRRHGAAVRLVANVRDATWLLRPFDPTWS